MAREGTTFAFTAEPPPDVTSEDAKRVVEWAYRQIQHLVEELQEVTKGTCEVRYSEPAKPRAGQIRVADGTQWDPGSGAGFYGYTIGGTWTKLG